MCREELRELLIECEEISSGLKMEVYVHMVSGLSLLTHCVLLLLYMTFEFSSAI